MKEYNRNPAALLETLRSASGSSKFRLENVPVSFDLDSFPTSAHCNGIVSVYGTVLKLGTIKFREKKGGRVDCQEIRLQDRSNIYLPQTITVQLEDELVDTCKPGELLRVTGIVRVKWTRARVGQKIECEYTIIALSIGKERTRIPKTMPSLPFDEHRRRSVILTHFAPQLSGCLAGKLGVLLCLIGGQDRKEEKEEDTVNSTEQLYREAQERNRSASHILLVGKAGTGKSELLRFAAGVAERAVQTTGAGCTSAGLTASAVRESNEWMIEPGALPRADRGVCCIDEFSELKKEDKASILEAMEQQTLTVAKAGILMRLNTRCTLVCAARHRFADVDQVLQSLRLSPPLVSRFDLILSIDESGAADQSISRRVIERAPDEADTAYVKEYIRSSKAVCTIVTPEAKSVIRQYYIRQKQLSPSATPRLLESHLRLSEAHAKLMHRSEVLETDALLAALMLNESLSCTGDTTLGYPMNRLLNDPEKMSAALEILKHDLL